MGNKRYRPIKKFLSGRRGETLVETIVSFVIVLIALAAITSMIRTATNMNARAQQNSDKIEQAATRVEKSEGTEAAGSMEIDFGDGNSVKMDLTVKEAEPFIYFMSESGGGET